MPGTQIIFWKKLSKSDLTIIQGKFKKTSNQQAIVLYRMFMEKLGFKFEDSDNRRIPVKVFFKGPQMKPAIEKNKATIQQQSKDWRLQECIIKPQIDDPQRFETLKKHDLLIVRVLKKEPLELDCIFVSQVQENELYISVCDAGGKSGFISTEDFLDFFPEEENLISAVSQETDNPELENNEYSDEGGFPINTSAAERKAIEKWSMKLANDYFVSLGFQVEDVSSIVSFGPNPYDLRCKKDKKLFKVEVKGTQKEKADVINLTKNEVEDTKNSSAGRKILFVVEDIQLRNENGEWIPSGGRKQIIRNWEINDQRLMAQQFSYKLDRDEFEEC